MTVLSRVPRSSPRWKFLFRLFIERMLSEEGSGRIETVQGKRLNKQECAQRESSFSLISLGGLNQQCTTELAPP